MTAVIGGGGLIGSAIVARLHADGRSAEAVPGIPWGDRSGVAEAFDGLARRLRLEFDDRVDRAPWRVVWAAGRAVIPSPAAAHRDEVAALDDLLGALGRRLGGRPGDLLLVSSAGGVYAGSDGPPFDERTAPVPRSAYGRGKLDQELLLAEAAVRHGWQARVGRVANVYGAGQDALKPQGLVTRLCRAVVLGEPVRLYVPAATARHYLHVSDAATLLLRLLDLPATGPGLPVLRVVTAGPTVTIAELVDIVRRVSGCDVPVVWSEDDDAGQHGIEIALATRDAAMHLTEPTPLVDGIEALLAAMREEAGVRR